MSEEAPRRWSVAELLTHNQARRIAADIAKLPELLLRSRWVTRNYQRLSLPRRAASKGRTGDAGDVTSLGDVRLSVRGLAIGVPDGPAH